MKKLAQLLLEVKQVVLFSGKVIDIKKDVFQENIKSLLFLHKQLHVRFLRSSSIFGLNRYTAQKNEVFS